MRQSAILVKSFIDPLTKKRRRYNWAIRWYDADGNRHFDTVANGPHKDPMGKRKAEDALRAKLNEIDATGGRIDPEREDVYTFFGEFITDHVERITGQLERTSRVDIERSLRLFEEKVTPGFVEEITFEMAEKFIKAISAELRTATVNKHIRNLKRAFGLAEARGVEFIDGKGNPFRTIKQSKGPGREKTWFKPAEFAKMLKGAKDDYHKLLFHLAYTTGLRLGELEHLRWEDVYLAPKNPSKNPNPFKVGQINSNDCTLTIREHKGGKRELPWKPKGKVRRVVPLTRRGVELLLARRADVQLSSPYVFISDDRLAVLVPKWRQGLRIINNLTDEMRRVLKIAGLANGCFHDFRVSACCNWLKQGLPPTTVQAMMGHANLKTTTEHYVLVDESAIEGARAASEAVERKIAAS